MSMYEKEEAFLALVQSLRKLPSGSFASVGEMLVLRDQLLDRDSQETRLAARTLVEAGFRLHAEVVGLLLSGSTRMSLCWLSYVSWRPGKKTSDDEYSPKPSDIPFVDLYQLRSLAIRLPRARKWTTRLQHIEKLLPLIERFLAGLRLPLLDPVHGRVYLQDSASCTYLGWVLSRRMLEELRILCLGEIDNRPVSKAAGKAGEKTAGNSRKKSVQKE